MPDQTHSPSQESPLSLFGPWNPLLGERSGKREVPGCSRSLSLGSPVAPPGPPGQQKPPEPWPEPAPDGTLSQQPGLCGWQQRKGGACRGSGSHSLPQSCSSPRARATAGRDWRAFWGAPGRWLFLLLVLLAGHLSRTLVNLKDNETLHTQSQKS